MLTIPLASEGAGIGHGVLAMHGGTGSGGEQEIPLGAMIFGSDLEDPPLGKMGAGPGLDSHRGEHLTTAAWCICMRWAQGGAAGSGGSDRRRCTCSAQERGADVMARGVAKTDFRYFNGRSGVMYKYVPYLAWGLIRV